METSTKLYLLNHSNVKTYLSALLLVAGNIALPQLCHLVPYGGPTLLLIYFFTLIAAYKYGFRVGSLTAVLSPVINHALSAISSEAILPIILIKSTLLASASTLTARTAETVSLLTVLGAILSYQLVRTVFKWMVKGDFYVAIQNFRTDISGMLIQRFGRYTLLKATTKF